MPLPKPDPSTASPQTRAQWGAEALWQALVPLLPGLSIEIVERLDSTNSELTERLRRAARVSGPRDGRAGRGGRSDDLLPQLVVATHQTAGRGRMGRRWHATPGASLTFSLSLPLARTDWSGLSLVVGLAVAEALDPQGRQLGLKWPNDIMRCQPGEIGSKVGGILIEAVSVGDRRAAVIGIGLNVQPQRMPESDIPHATLVETWPEATAQAALARIAPVLARALLDFDRDGFAPRVDDYARRDVLRGLLIRTSDPATLEGVAAGVDVDGALKLVAGNESHRVISGEVSVRPVAGR